MRSITKLAITVFLFSCQSQQGAKVEQQSDTLVLRNPDTTHATAIPASDLVLPFVDSISKKYELTIAQIRKYTTVDSVFYTDFHAAALFTGDTTFTLHNGYTGAIIKYNDGRSCVHKMFLVFSPGNYANTDYKIISSDCDRDESANYIILHYKFLNDSSFQTIETLIPPHSEVGRRDNQIEKTKWKINDSGKIEQI